MRLPLLLMLALVSSALPAQDDRLARRYAADRAMSDALRERGITYVGEHLLVRAMAQDLPQDALRSFGARADRGVGAIRRYLGPAFDPRGDASRKPEIILSRDAGPSHASFEQAHVYIDPRRVLDHSAPYLHELTHVLAAWSSGRALWLQEGFAEHVASRVAAPSDGYHFSPLDNAIAALDPAHASSDAGRSVLPLVGLDGVPYAMTASAAQVYAPLFAERRKLAAPFYNLSWSFVDHLAARIGLAGLQRIGQHADTAAGVEAVTSRSLDDWKSEWLARIASDAAGR